MFNFFKRKKPRLLRTQIAAIPPLYFKDGASAFKYCCEYVECPLTEGSYLPAIVVDARNEFQAKVAVLYRHLSHRRNVCL
jgi:hypothetical protein